MVIHEGVKVTVHRHRDDTPYYEYAQTRTKAGSQEVYIEAISDERFYITVELEPGFDFKAAPSIGIAVAMDGKPWFISYLHAKTGKRAKNSATITTHRDSIINAQRFIDGKCMSCGLVFAELHLDGGMKHSNETVSPGLERLGCIDIRVVRGSTKICKPIRSDGLCRIPKMHAACEEDVKRRHVTHFVSYLPLTKCRIPIRQTDFSPAMGEPGHVIGFVFQYRSKDALRTLKIIPECVQPLPLVPSTSTMHKSQPVPKRKRAETYEISSDDDGETLSRKAKEVGVHQPKPRSNPNTKAEHCSLTTRTTATATGVYDQALPRRVKPRFEPVVKVEDDELEIIEERPARLATAPASSEPSTPNTQGADEHDRERRKTLLRMRLAEMKLERELFELGN